MSEIDDDEMVFDGAVAPDQMDGSSDGYQFDDESYGRVGSGTTTPSVHYVNESGVPTELVRADRRFQAEVASIIDQWSRSLSPGRGVSTIDVFSRTKWASATHPFSIMSQCAWAVENDDILSTLADVIEGLTFKKIRFEVNDADQQDIWNQWARDVDMDSRMREMFRELFKVSQVYVGLWWDDVTYNVRDNPLAATIAASQAQAAANAAALAAQTNPDGSPNPDAPQYPAEVPASAGPGKGNRKRKKKFAVKVPTAMTIFDPLKILPVGTLMFGRERFVYIADDNEQAAFEKAMKGDVIDATVLKLLESQYSPTPQDVLACGELGVASNRLWLMREDAVFRVTRTKAQYERFAPVRLKAILEILDLKTQMRAADRSALIGNTNFIVLITKGSDKLPAKGPEIDNLKQETRMIGRLPVLVGDHRLDVKIVTPAMDHTLQESRWQVLDSHLVFKALQSFQPLVQGGNSTTGVSEMGRVVSQGLENQRHMLVRAVERFILSEMVKRNPLAFTEDPDLAFAPKRVTLDFNQDIMNAILKLRDRGDVSRETTLDEFDYDQDVEAARRANEKAVYDPVFNSQTPYGSPTSNPYGQDGQGGQSPPGTSGAPAPAPADTTPAGGRPKGKTEAEPRKPSGSVRA